MFGPRELRELVAGTSAADLPELRAELGRGAIALALVLLPAAMIEIGFEALRGNAIAGPAIVMILANVLVCGGVAFLAQRDWGRQNPETLLLALALFLVVDLAANTWIRADHATDMLVYAPIAPLLMVAFASWRPMSSIAVGVWGLAVVLLVEVTFGLEAPISHSMVTFMGLSAAVAGAAASQARRRLWCRLQKTRVQLEASERMSSLGRMTAGIAHELKTPLAAAMNSLETIRGLSTELGESIGHANVTPDDMREIASELGAAARLADATVRRATSFVYAIRAHTTEMNETVRAPFSVADAVSGVVTLLGHATRRAGIAVDTSDVAPGLVVVGDAGKFTQIMTNVVGNAVTACRGSPGARIIVRAAPKGDGVLIVVEDSGPGVPPAIRERIFEPLFTTNASEGTGLGLSISRDLAQGAFGGTLRLVESPVGARFELRLPGSAALEMRQESWSPGMAAVLTR